MTKFTQTLIASAVAFSAAGVHAAAFQLAEVSTSGLGMAYAGNAAVADNAAVVATNPALMTQFKRTELSAGGVYIDSDIDIQGKITMSGRDASQKNIVPNAIVPNAYIVTPISDRFALGGGVNVNYGLKSEFSQNYSAGFFGGRTDLSAVNLNLSGAYQLGYGLSVGVGLNAVHAKAELERYFGAVATRYKGLLQQNRAGIDAAITALTQLEAAGSSATVEAQKQAVLANVNNTLQTAGLTQTVSSATDLRLLVAAVESLSESSVIHKLKGDKWGFGWNAGLVYEFNENNRIGASYHSKIDLNFKGKYSNTVPFAVPNMVNTITGGAEISGNLKLSLPAFWEIAGYHKLTDKLAVQYSYKYTEWRKFKSLDAYATDGTALFHKTENFNDASRIAIGLSYDVNDALTLRTGIAHDESASVANPSISIPDTNRTWYSLGFTYRFSPNLSADVGYSHLRGSKNTFNEDGLADFNVKARANLYGLNVNYKF